MVGLVLSCLPFLAARFSAIKVIEATSVTSLKVQVVEAGEQVRKRQRLATTDLKTVEHTQQVLQYRYIGMQDMHEIRHTPWEMWRMPL